MNIHFIGIGGIGLSALARYYLNKGHNIAGSDLTSSEMTKSLEGKGAQVAIGPHKPDNVEKETDLIIYSQAVKKDNPERKKGEELGIPVKSYPEALGELSKKYFTIAVSGSHGKSTVTAMIGIILSEAKMDPTVIVGTKVKEFDNTNFRAGNSQFLVIEACEHFASFLNYWPKMAVLTSVEADHLDFHGSFDNLVESFKNFVSHLPPEGVLIANGEDKNIKRIIASDSFNSKVSYYSLKDSEADSVKNLLKIPGDFNIANALAALTVARLFKIPDEISFKALSEYQGSWRRFDVKETRINGKAVTLIDDYGHHPTQIKVMLKAAKEKYPERRIWCLYQPHQYQRTQYLFNEFTDVFRNHPIDKVIITDIYSVAGREKKEVMEKVSSQKLVEATAKDSVIYVAKEKIEKFIKDNIHEGQVLIVMGAGDIYDTGINLQES